MNSSSSKGTCPDMPGQSSSGMQIFKISTAPGSARQWIIIFKHRTRLEIALHEMPEHKLTCAVAV